MPPIPGPLQRLFDLFPLVTYPANELPSRSPGPSNLPTLYVFASEEGARKGSPSFNPTCLKWQVSSDSDIPRRDGFFPSSRSWGHVLLQRRLNTNPAPRHHRTNTPSRPSSR